MSFALLKALDCLFETQWIDLNHFHVSLWLIKCCIPDLCIYSVVLRPTDTMFHYPPPHPHKIMDLKGPLLWTLNGGHEKVKLNYIIAHKCFTKLPTFTQIIGPVIFITSSNLCFRFIQISCLKFIHILLPTIHSPWRHNRCGGAMCEREIGGSVIISFQCHSCDVYNAAKLDWAKTERPPSPPLSQLLTTHPIGQ